ncbi:unnamed protein product, partial [marine sediment metagenome]
GSKIGETGEMKDFQQISRHGPLSKIPQMAEKRYHKPKRLARSSPMNIPFYGFWGHQRCGYEF